MEDLINVSDLNALIEQLKNTKQIHPQDVPNIDLYMDQLITFLDANTENLKSDEKLPFITNTMVNNYAKAGLLPPVIKKRYTRDHVLTLCVVGQLKRILSIQSLKKIIDTVSVEKFSTDLYNVFLDEQKKNIDNTDEIIINALETSEKEGFDGDSLIAAAAIALSTEAQYKVMLAEKLLSLIDTSKKPDEKQSKKTKEEIIKE